MMNTPHYWAVIPAAGVGKRMGSHIPKQYLPLAGQTVLQHTINLFLKHADISGIVLAITDNDPYWQDIVTCYNQKNSKPIIVASGGQERCYSVLNALNLLSDHAQDNDWVLVHDAARPCLLSSDIDLLMSELKDSACGGLLGIPMADTVKRCDPHNQVLATVDRSDLWRALTPQMFPLKLLKDALTHALNNNQEVTDEASAIELQGLQPLIVEGQASNIKITHPSDLSVAERFFNDLS
ncbi:MAG: 2-C-methyl-D-erythritol 4-phosphate cytidylyltransferase [Gammaproteobacteria bacterium]|nr:2-C-methyl-D-erythritol 4-phosphate cytidylyltransferase [Gammaproteobacteria bacterium]